MPWSVLGAIQKEMQFPSTGSSTAVGAEALQPSLGMTMFF